MRRNSGIIGPEQRTLATAANGLYDLFDCYNFKKNNSWPQFQVESISNSTGTTLNENISSTFTVTTSDLQDGTTLYYSIVTLAGPTLTSVDFAVGDVTGSFTITNNSGSFGLKLIGDNLQEANIVKIQIRRGSVSGDILAETGILTVGDAAPPVASAEFNWKYYAYGSDIGSTYILWVQSNGTQNTLRTIAGQQHNSNNLPWISYTENLSSYSGTTGRIYIAYQVGANYAQDVQFDDMELIDTTAGDISHDPTTATGRGRWEKTTSSTSTLVPPPSATWQSIVISTSASNVWNWDAGGTPSGSTGATADAAGSTTGLYLYFEGSSPNYSTSTRFYWVRMSQDYTLL